MIHRFGIFEFDDEGGELRKNGRAVALEPQPAKALALLLSKAGAVVSREELRDAVWGADTHVDFDRGIAYCLSQIRSALGDSGDNPRFVQTIPKRGVKFVAPASPAKRSRALAVLVVVLVVFAVRLLSVLGPSRQATAAPAIVAVSVFDNETGQAEYDRPVAHLSDAVVERLTRLDPGRIAVIGNAAVLRQPRNIRNLKAVAQGLKADYVLLGQLQRGDTGLRFITHVIRLRDEAHLKANRLAVADEQLMGLEAAVTEEFERAVREHVLKHRSN